MRTATYADVLCPRHACERLETLHNCSFSPVVALAAPRSCVPFGNFLEYSHRPGQSANPAAALSARFNCSSCTPTRHWHGAGFPPRRSYATCAAPDGHYPSQQLWAAQAAAVRQRAQALRRCARQTPCRAEGAAADLPTPAGTWPELIGYQPPRIVLSELPRAMHRLSGLCTLSGDARTATLDRGGNAGVHGGIIGLQGSNHLVHTASLGPTASAPSERIALRIVKTWFNASGGGCTAMVDRGANRARLDETNRDLVLGELDGWPTLRGLGSDCEYRLSATRSLCFSVEARPQRAQYRYLGIPVNGIPFRRSEVDPITPRAGLATRAGLARSARRGYHGVTRAAALGLAGRLPRCRRERWDDRQCGLHLLARSAAMLHTFMEAPLHTTFGEHVRDDLELLKLDQFCMDPDDGSLTVCDTDYVLWYPSRPVLMPTASVLLRREGVPAGLKAHGFRDLPLYLSNSLFRPLAVHVPLLAADLDPLINEIDARHAAILATVDGGEATSQLSFSCIHAWLARRLAGEAISLQERRAARQKVGSDFR